MTTVIGVTVYAADDFPGLYCCCPTTAFDNPVTQITNHRCGNFSHHFVAKNRKYVTVDHRLLHCAGTVSQDDVFHITVGMYRKRLGTTNLFDTVTFSRSRRLACFKQLLCSNQFFSRFCQADTVAPILPDYQCFAATVDTVVIAKRDRT